MDTAIEPKHALVQRVIKDVALPWGKPFCFYLKTFDLVHILCAEFWRLFIMYFMNLPRNNLIEVKYTQNIYVGLCVNDGIILRSQYVMYVSNMYLCQSTLTVI